MRHLLLTLLTILLITACQTGPSGDDPSPDGLERYELRGKVLSFDKKTRVAAIEHEKIPGYMDAMTMDFEIRKPEWAVEKIKPGATVTGDLVVDNAAGKYWLEVEGIVDPPSGQEATPLRDDKAVAGQKIPDFTLTNQDGEPVSAADFRGKALAITFIYSECPLPEFCILMSKNFSDLANKVAREEDLKDRIRLLSISFDPDRDTPEKLKKYGLGYLGKNSPATDFEIWQLAVGEDRKVREIADFFGLRYEVDPQDRTQFNHSLRTIVISPEGRVAKVLPGGGWTPDDLLGEMKKTLNQTPPPPRT